MERKKRRYFSKSISFIWFCCFLSFLFIYQKNSTPHWLCCRVCPFPLFQKWFHLALFWYFFVVVVQELTQPKKNSRQGFGTCAVVRDAIPPYTEWESEAITAENRHTIFLSVLSVCWFLFYFFFYRRIPRAHFLSFFFSFFNSSIVPFHFSFFILEILSCFLLLRWSPFFYFFVKRNRWLLFGYAHSEQCFNTS